MIQAARAIIVQDGQLLVMKRNKYGHEYYTLVGGGVSRSETVGQALVREVAEETGLQVAEARLVFIEEAGAPFGTQYVYLCRHVRGEPKLSPHTEEAKIHALGQNLYTPMWLPLNELHDVEFVSEPLKYAILDAIKNGFPDQTKTIDPAHYHSAVHKRSN